MCSEDSMRIILSLNKCLLSVFLLVDYSRKYKKYKKSEKTFITLFIIYWMMIFTSNFVILKVSFQPLARIVFYPSWLFKNVIDYFKKQVKSSWQRTWMIKTIYFYKWKKSNFFFVDFTRSFGIFMVCCAPFIVGTGLCLSAYRLFMYFDDSLWQ